MGKTIKQIAKSGTIFLLLWAFSTILFFGSQTMRAQNKEPINTDETVGRNLYFKGRDMFYNGDGKIGEAVSVLLSSMENFSKLPESATKYYWLSRVSFTQAEISEVTGNKREAAVKFTESVDWIQRALQYNDKFSDFYRLLADNYMRLTAYNGALYTASHGPLALRLAHKAIRLDNQNYAAFNTIGIYCIHAPLIGGGNVNKGIKNLKKALASTNRFDRFISHIWLGNAYLKKNNKIEALNHFHLALEIYPNSPWAKEFITHCNQKK